MSAFLAALRLSRREALRAKGRTALVMAMIGLPVLVFTALLTYDATVDVAPGEDITAELGAADARIVTTAHDGRVSQPVHGWFMLAAEGPATDGTVRTADEVTALLDARLIPYDVGSVEIRDTDRYHEVSALELDLRDPMTQGIRLLAEGRFPASADEVAVTPALARGSGLRVGDTITVTARDRRVRVVGVVEHPHNVEIQEVVGLQHTLLLDKRGGHGPGWLADSARPVLWEDVQRLNGIGMLVTSRAVLTGPPVAGAYGDPFDRALGAPALMTLAAMAVLVVMEMALLTGPAFAVGLRRRRRELALIAAQGGSARHLKVIVLADGLVLGGVAALLGAALGTGGTLALMPLLKRLLGQSGPADVPWGPVLGVTALGVAGALVAALVPAVSAGRQDPARVLADREESAGAGVVARRARRFGVINPRGARRPALAGSRRGRLPVLAGLLLVGGLAVTVYALRGGRPYGVIADAFLLLSRCSGGAGTGRAHPGHGDGPRRARRAAAAPAPAGRTRRRPPPDPYGVRGGGGDGRHDGGPSRWASGWRARSPSPSRRTGPSSRRTRCGSRPGRSTTGDGPTCARPRPRRCRACRWCPRARRSTAREGRADPGGRESPDRLLPRGPADRRRPPAGLLPGTARPAGGRGAGRRQSGGVRSRAAPERHPRPPVDRGRRGRRQSRPDPRRGGGVRRPGQDRCRDPARGPGEGRVHGGRAGAVRHAPVRRRPAPATAAQHAVRARGRGRPGQGGALDPGHVLVGVRPGAAPQPRRHLGRHRAGRGRPAPRPGHRVGGRRAAQDAQGDPGRSGGFIAGIGALVGAAGGAVMGAAMAVPLTRERQPLGALDGLGPAVIAVPWAATALVVLGPPLLAALVAGLVTRSRQGPPGRRFA
ncbi:ABC transporter permease [Nonomuraea ferruginea]